MAKFIAALFLLFSSTIALAQQEASIQHYQRFLTIDSVPLPYTAFDKSSLTLTIPDSLYSGGNVAVKKCTWNGEKGFRLQLSFSNNVVQEVSLTAKGRKRVALLNELEAKVNTYNMDAGQVVDIEKVKQGKRISLVLRTKPN